MIPRPSAYLRAWRRLPKSFETAAVRSFSDSAITRQSPRHEESLYAYEVRGIGERMMKMNAQQKSELLRNYGNKRLQNSEDGDIECRLRDSGRSPFRFLRDHIDSGTASTSVVSACLEAQWRLLQPIPRTLRQERYRAQNENIATEILMLIWSDEKLWLPLVAYDWEATARLCCFAVLEEKDHLILEWTVVRTQFKDDHWRGVLLRNLIAAHAMVMHCSADSALATFLKAVQMKADALSVHRQNVGQIRQDTSPAVHCDLFPAAVRLSGVLSVPGLHYTSPVLFEDFLQFSRGFERFRAPDRAYQMSRLQLYHPRKPDHEPAMSLLRKVYRGEPTIFSQSDNAKMAKSLEDFVLRTALVADYNDNEEDVRWLKEAFRDHLEAAKGRGPSPLAVNQNSISTVEGGLLVRRVKYGVGAKTR